MATNLSIDENLLNQAVKLGRHKTKKSAVNEALREYVLHRKQQEVVELFGQVIYESEYDYKANRSR